MCGREVRGRRVGACACEVAVPHERRTMADICSELSRRLSSRRKSRPVKTVLSEERIWKVVELTCCRMRKMRLLFTK